MRSIFVCITILRGMVIAKQARRKKALEFILNTDLKLEAQLLKAEIDALNEMIDLIQKEADKAEKEEI